MKPYVHNRDAQTGRKDAFTLTFPYDITGYTFAAQIKSKTGTTVATYSVAVNVPAKTAAFTLSAAVTTGITAGAYLYDVKMTPPGGDPTTVMGGTVNFGTPVTA